MLTRLTVKNYALIDELDIAPGKGFNIITGETGAGKSILLGALSLILGQRADTQALLDKKQKCIVEGEFEIEQYHLQDFFARNDLDYASHTLLRREISSEGKSRAFINDTPVSVAQIKQLGSMLVDIHSQHETLTLANSVFQLSIVDTIAGHSDNVQSFKSDFKKYKTLCQELDELMERERNTKNDLDYFTFQFEELQAAALKSFEQEGLEGELKKQEHAEEIKSVLTKVSDLLEGNGQGVVEQLTEAKTALRQVEKFHGDIEKISQRLQVSFIELRDINDELQNIANATTYDQERVGQITERLDTINQLQAKHRVNSIEQLLVVMDELDARLQSISSAGVQLERLTAEKEKQFGMLSAQAAKLSAQRAKAIPGIEKSIKVSLKELGIPNGSLQIVLNKLEDEEMNSAGLDNIEFCFSANKGVDFKPLGKVASGGELSRLMLAIKALVAGNISFPTLIFDEIDTGVSGETAFKVGDMLERIATRHQVMAITHLPQIAGKGTQHFFVHKEVKGNKTVTRLRQLDNNERVVEIAKMIGGEKPSETAMDSARELLSH